MADKPFSPAAVAGRHPVLVFIALTFAITWSVWFCVPWVAGPDWALGKIVTGLAFGPALAAIVMDRWRGTGATFGDRIWWMRFFPVFAIVATIDLSILLTGDAITAGGFAIAQPPGLSPLGVASALSAAAVAGFIVAMLAGSRSPRLSSVFRWRAPLRWWLAALFLPAGWMLLGVLIAWTTGSPIESASGGLPPPVWGLFLLRSTLFTLLVVAVGEEAGWRGWMLPELQKRMSPLASTALIGVVWGLWHYPLFVNGQYPDDPQMVFAKVGVCVLLGILFTWLYNRSGGNLLLAVVLHTTLNNTARVMPFTEYAGVGMLVLLLVLVIADRMWRRRGKATIGGDPAEPPDAEPSGASRSRTTRADS
ncbi:CPBP family intramembrane metalloprotease [Luteimonas sp. SJ-92]|uniref:CPBP family intramembrane metalloprotease n=1 Tax=Luteimonas salinisoli TaxID=2752307 RepID=A0A853JC70_9GAMM|nr:type II CAAX endopeptidase family protein [Luteimonas salinisoli]NZA26190.1 CPBP family intramembrane metalloprotease [Luteimonas salinisoli]